MMSEYIDRLKGLSCCRCVECSENGSQYSVNAGNKEFWIQEGKNARLKISLGEGSNLTLLRIFDIHSKTEVRNNTEIELNGAGNLNVLDVIISRGNLDNELNISFLNGSEGSSCTADSIILASGDSICRQRTMMSHQSGRCHSDQLIKLISSGRAKAEFDGLIKVCQDAQKTDAYQRNNCLLLSPQAQAKAQPHLEIYADDVRCSHGSATGQMDEEELFYMQSRGIPRPEAREMLVRAFVNEPLERFPEEQARKVLEDIITDAFDSEPNLIVHSL